MWLTWQQGLWLAGVCALVYVATARLPTPVGPSRPLRLAHGTRTVLGEVVIIALLYSLWQRVFALTVTRTAGAMDHARWIYDVEGSFHLPDELTIQRWSMTWDGLIRFLNWYYAYLHIPALGVMLVWLFFLHRDRYSRIRNVLALATGACLAIQSIPVAPPRFFPDLGFVDTGLVFGQSVYGEGGSGISNQLAAMPSVHVTWAVLVAAAFVSASVSAWRWLAVAHPVITTWAVVATANHWWADGIVAVVLLGLALASVVGIDRLIGHLRPDATEPDRDGRVPFEHSDPAGVDPAGDAMISSRASDSRSPS